MSLFRPLITNDVLGMERSMRQVQNAMNSMFGDILIGGPTSLTHNESNNASRQGFMTGWAPRIDISETEKEFDIKADLPGLTKSNVKVEVHDDCLWISGETAKESEKDEGTVHVRERFRGSFKRGIPLPKTANTDTIDAMFDHGVLTVAIPKKSPAETGAKVINIQ